MLTIKICFYGNNLNSFNYFKYILNILSYYTHVYRYEWGTKQLWPDAERHHGLMKVKSTW